MMVRQRTDEQLEGGKGDSRFIPALATVRPKKVVGVMMSMYGATASDTEY